MIELILLLAIPLGIILASITTHEVHIYNKKQYFPAISISLFLISIITFNIDKLISLTLLFTFLTTLVWSKA